MSNVSLIDGHIEEPKMTDNEIIKALEYCVEQGITSECEKCNINEVDCRRELIAIALDLINRKNAEIDKLTYTIMGIMHSVDKWLDGDELKQDEVNRAATMREKTLRIVEKQKADIERLNVELVGMRGAANSYKMHYDKSQAKNKELWEERNRIYESLKETEADLEEYRKAYGKAKAEGAKEVIERLKEEATVDDDMTWWVASIDVDKVLKEMVGE